jgi:hypothetical protein
MALFLFFFFGSPKKSVERERDSPVSVKPLLLTHCLSLSRWKIKKQKAKKQKNEEKRGRKSIH